MLSLPECSKHLIGTALDVATNLPFSWFGQEKRERGFRGDIYDGLHGCRLEVVRTPIQHARINEDVSWYSHIVKMPTFRVSRS